MAEKTGAVNGRGVDDCHSNGCGGTNYIPGRGGKNGKGNGIAREQVWAPEVSPPDERMNSWGSNTSINTQAAALKESFVLKGNAQLAAPAMEVPPATPARYTIAALRDPLKMVGKNSARDNCGSDDGCAESQGDPYFTSGRGGRSGRGRGSGRILLDNCLTMSWAETQQKYNEWLVGCQNPGLRWTIAIIKKLRDIAWDVWEHRNVPNVKQSVCVEVRHNMELLKPFV